jgi:DNA-binding NarL/FixJ family response regulator
MNGLDALPELLAIVPDALIVVYTSDDSAATRAEAFSRGAGAFATKGITPVRDVLAIVREHRALGSSPA